MNSGEKPASDRGAASAKQMTLKKKLFSSFAILCITVIALELGSLVIYPLLFKKSFSRQTLQRKLMTSIKRPDQPSAPEAKPQFRSKSHILHPYFGFVANPGSYRLDLEFSRGGLEMKINEEGFLGESPLTKRAKDRVTICLLGGSFAMNLYLDSRETLKRVLSGYDQFKGKEIVIVSLAMSGYKQPQQILALNYYLSLGAEYDIVINLDGFNELVLPLAENAPQNVYPFFPRMWNFYASRTLDVEATLRYAQLVESTERRRKLRNTFSNPILSFPNFGLILWEALDRKMEGDISRQTVALQNLMRENSHPSATREFEKTGPTPPRYSSHRDYFAGMADHWARSSLLLNRLARTGDFAYFHFLQPNQYVKNSKTFSREEEVRAVFKGGEVAGNPFSIAVEGGEMGYPMLVEKGVELARHGVLFTDLTMIYQGNRETLYEDMVCHVNKVGNDLVATRMASVIGKHFKVAGQ